jgi:hypothetical protein
MKKQAVKKLELSRETLRALDMKALTEVAGADTKQNSCDTVTVFACTATDRTACSSCC